MTEKMQFRSQDIFPNLVLATVYFLTASFALIVSISIGNASPIWPPSGIALASLLKWGYFLAPGVWFGAFLGNIWVVFSQKSLLFPQSVLVAIMIGTGAMLQALFGSFLIKKIIKNQDIFDQSSQIFQFLAIEFFVCTISPTFGVSGLYFLGLIPENVIKYSWITWWLGDLAGVLLFTPLILICTRKIHWKIPRQKSLVLLKLSEIFLWFFLLGIIAKVSFVYHYPVEYLMIPLLLWSAFRLGQRGTIIALLIVDGVATIGSIYGVSSFVRENINDTLLLLQAFIGSVTVTTLVLSAVIKQQKLAESKLEKSHSELEFRVEERTRELQIANREIQKLNQQLQAENMRMSTELDITRRLQKMILPKEAELDKIQELDIAGFMEPAEEVGGDYYDIIVDQEFNDYIKIGIGDVTGHGLESGVLMIMIQTAVRTLVANNETDLNKIINTLNRVIYENIERIQSDKFITFSFLNYSHGHLTITGQHEEVILVRKGGIIERIDTLDLGFPLGLESDISSFVNCVHLNLNSGDGIVLYTDGITEAENLYKKLYGLERLCYIIQQNWEKPSPEIRQKVITDIQRYVGTHKVYDDITLVVIKKR